MDLKEYLAKNVPELDVNSVDNDPASFDHEYEAAYAYYKKYGFTDEDRKELYKRGFDENQEEIWKDMIKEEKDFEGKKKEEIREWREGTYRPLKACAEKVQQYCYDHEEPATYGCYFKPDIGELDELCGIDNVRMIVANHVRIHTGPKDGASWDGRFGEKVRKWAWTVPEIPQCPYSTENRTFYDIGLGNLHSTLCDSLADKVIEYEKTKTLVQPDRAPKKKGHAR